MRHRLGIAVFLVMLEATFFGVVLTSVFSVVVE
jgi:hypothetical protein